MTIFKQFWFNKGDKKAFKKIQNPLNNQKIPQIIEFND